MNAQTFLFYDLETSGLSPKTDRIMQFAGQRTDLDLNPIGGPINLLVKLPDDTLPSPYAIMTTGITPQSTFQDGLTEAEFANYLQTTVFTPGTCAVGYNSVRFDDEFMRYLFWRCFYDPYEWQWQDGRSRWDLLDVVRLTRALRPEGINWPVTPEGRATNRLELLTKENGISHAHAHDALSDVEALISITRLIKTRQPRLYDYLFKLRAKRQVQALVNLESPQPFVYASGRYSADYDKTTVAFPIAPSRNGNVLVYNLRYNLDEVLDQRAKDGDQASDTFFPIVKELAYNKCPAVAPLGVLEQGDGWQKIKLDPATVKRNYQSLIAHPDFVERVRTATEQQPEWPAAPDPESALYDGFLPDSDRVRCNAVRNADLAKLADFHPPFIDERLSPLLLHYKARNFPSALSESEQASWQEYRQARLNRQAPDFMRDLTELSRLAAAEKPMKNGKVPDQFLLDELQLYYQSLADTDY